MTTFARSEESSRKFEPHAEGWRNFIWPGGSFDTAFRPQTQHVEGKIVLRNPTIMTVLKGGCQNIEIISDCGLRYKGEYFSGSVSFLPPDCGRYIKMKEVRSEWASLSIRPDFFCVSDERGNDASIRDVGTFTNRHDPFLHTMLAELQRLHLSGEGLDGLYCDAMAVSAAQYIMRRYGSTGRENRTLGKALPGWRLRRIAEYVNANLSNPGLRLDDVARCVGLSTGFFHRAFKQTTGETPLAHIQRLRIQRAMQLLMSRDLSVLQVAMEVGFLSPSHFARIFHRQVGMTPSQYRNGRHLSESPGAASAPLRVEHR